MTWAGISYNGKTPIRLISTKMNAEMYSNLLEDVLLTQNFGIPRRNFTFQHDNASIHAARHTKKFLKDKKIPVLEWAACSPDLNPIENVWSLLSRSVYANGRQFNNVKELKTQIEEEWNKIDRRVIRNHIESMENRLQQVILEKGGHTTY